ncbi:hypothetical protein, partial [Tepidimonas sp.]|uniref:hypothetical protein n=1 Tax=Tepidimonas sp. TaxID=2002775 RepID=UPI002FE151C2
MERTREDRHRSRQQALWQAQCQHPVCGTAYLSNPMELLQATTDTPVLTHKDRIALPRRGAHARQPGRLAASDTAEKSACRRAGNTFDVARLAGIEPTTFGFGG